MKFCRTFLLLFLLPFVVAAQNGVYYIPSEKEADSMRVLLSQTHNDTLKMFAYYELSSFHTELNKEISLYYADLQLQSAKQLHQSLWVADAYFQISYLSFGLGNYPKAFDAVKEGLAITDDEQSEKNNWQIKKIAADGNARRARLYIAAAIHLVFGFLYENTDDYQKAKAQYIAAINLAEAVDNKAELSLDYMCLAAIYMQVDKNDSALIYNNKARVFALQSNYQIYMGTILKAIGDIYYSRSKYDSAGIYYKDALKAAGEQTNLKDVINANIAVARWLRKTGKADSSIVYAKNALMFSQLLGIADGRRSAYNSLYTGYLSLNKKDSAFVFLQLAKTLGDSLDNVQRNKINEYQRLNLDNQVQKQETEKAKIQYQNKIRMYALLAGIGALIIIAVLLLRNSRNRKKANDLLQNQKEQIELQKTNIEQALTELKATQSQLIQSEKMASLGELTAGIAHEIQNPLNFVNNFSEVNKELIEELKDERLKAGGARNKELEDELIHDIEENSAKINHHGRRADAIVKGMLEHSRTNTGTKEPANINALCDEYLRLAYHGLRAKDKDFNATLKTDFDPEFSSVKGRINIVQQDIGRVLLNLYNNAFYAVNERRKLAAVNYEPLIVVSTKRINDKVEIKVADNGSGIPQNIADKIFQPFFTTKPTGQGTGLGLSLSYDIIKAHGGEIKVETKENAGTTFIIHLQTGILKD